MYQNLKIILVLYFLSINSNLLASSKIIGGWDIDEAHFHAAISTYSENEFTTICGGTIIKPNWILTAAHCLESLSDTSLYISPSVVLRSSIPHHKIEVKAVFPHPQYNPTTIQNDIALLYVEEEIVLKDDSIQFSNPTSPWSTYPLQAVGFGNTTSYGFLASDNLQAVDLNLLSIEECTKLNPLYTQLNLNESQICTTSQKGYGQDTCQGDSGGSLIVKTENGTHLIGITSFGIGCAQKKQPGVSTFVPFFEEWILKTINNFHSLKDKHLLSSNFCFDRLDPIIEDDQDTGSNYISMYQKQVNTRPTLSYHENLFDIKRDQSLINSCAFTSTGNDYIKNDYIIYDEDKKFLLSESKGSHGSNTKVKYEYQESFDVLCFNEGTENFLVTLSTDYTGSYSASINLSPVLLNETEFIPESLSSFATCKYKDSEFSILKSDSNHFFATIKGLDFNSQDTKYFKAIIPDQNENFIQLEISLKEGSNKSQKASFSFFNNTHVDIFKWQLTCEGLSFSLGQTQQTRLSSQSDIFGAYPNEDEYLFINKSITMEGEVSFSLPHNQIQCLINDQPIKINIHD